MSSLDKKTVVSIFEHVADIMSENKDLLCSLDAELGDGDLGLTMPKAFAAAALEANASQETDLGKMLMKMGMKMNSAAPSTMGTLMSSGVIAAGKALAGKESLSRDDAATFFTAFANGVAARGKASRGERTVLDSLYPAADAAAACHGMGGSIHEIAIQAHEGAKQGLEATKSMSPKYGKAAVFIDKAVGKIDQGALVGVLLMEGICRGIPTFQTNLRIV